MCAKNQISLLILLSTGFHVFAQSNASSLIVGIIESHNRQLNDLATFISPDATCSINGISQDTSALIIFSENFRFLSAAYNQAKLTIKDVLVDSNTASAEWIFADSVGEIGRGSIIIRLSDNKVSSISIYNGERRKEAGTNTRFRRIRSRGSISRNDETASPEQYWYYLRTSLGGFVDPAGVHFSQYFICDSPGSIDKKFLTSHLNGPFESRQEAGSSRQLALNTLKSSGINLHSTEVSCGN